MDKEDFINDFNIKKNQLLKNLRIPRKPKWDKNTTTKVFLFFTKIKFKSNFVDKLINRNYIGWKMNHF